MHRRVPPNLRQFRQIPRIQLVRLVLGLNHCLGSPWINDDHLMPLRLQLLRDPFR
jgi:hypothetical protein